MYLESRLPDVCNWMQIEDCILFHAAARMHTIRLGSYFDHASEHSQQ